MNVCIYVHIYVCVFVCMFFVFPSVILFVLSLSVVRISGVFKLSETVLVRYLTEAFVYLCILCQPI